MKIIRVTSCHDCPYPTEEDGSDYLIFYCEYDNAPKGLIVGFHIKNKTMPENCPLEDEIDMKAVSEEDYFLYTTEDGETIT